MIRGTFVIRDGKLVPKHEAPPLVCVTARSGLPRPYIQSDTCEFVSMASGETVTSKAKYRDDLRARGLVEVGNESFNAAPTYEPEAVDKTISDAWDQLAGT